MVNATQGLLWLAGPRYSFLARKMQGTIYYREPLSILGAQQYLGATLTKRNLTRKPPLNIQSFKILEVMLQQSGRWNPSPLSRRSVHEAV